MSALNTGRSGQPTQKPGGRGGRDVTGTSARRAVRLAITGAAPLFAWEAFSIFYYGSAVPITAYAKALAPGIATGSLIEQGCRYVAYTATHDPATVAVTAAGITVALLRGVIE